MGGFFVAILRRKDGDIDLTRAHTVPHATSKRAASQDPETSAPDTKRVKVTCLFCEPPSKQMGFTGNRYQTAF